MSSLAEAKTPSLFDRLLDAERPKHLGRDGSLADVKPLERKVAQVKWTWSEPSAQWTGVGSRGTAIIKRVDGRYVAIVGGCESAYSNIIDATNFANARIQ